MFQASSGLNAGVCPLVVTLTQDENGGSNSSASVISESIIKEESENDSLKLKTQLL